MSVLDRFRKTGKTQQAPATARTPIRTRDIDEVWAPITDKGMRITKTNDEEQTVFGWAYVSETNKGEQVIDHSGEYVLKEDLEAAAYVFNMVYREGDEAHTEDVAAHLIESFVVTPDKLAKMGLPDDALPRGWWTGWFVPDAEVYAKVRDGEYQMLSIGGYAQKEVSEVA